jgi:hypothetical protein
MARYTLRHDKVEYIPDHFRLGLLSAGDASLFVKQPHRDLFSLNSVLLVPTGWYRYHEQIRCVECTLDICSAVHVTLLERTTKKMFRVILFVFNHISFCEEKFQEAPAVWVACITS